MPQPQIQRPAAPERAANGEGVSLIDTYNALFETIPATTPELMQESFRLRYQVYCVENDFLDPAANPGGLETDEYDGHSLHALLRHRATGIIAGTIRLVLPKPGATRGSLPLHAVCQDPRLATPDYLPPTRTAEFSRFAISKQFRRRAGDELYGRPLSEEEKFDKRRIIPHLTLGLMAAALQMTRGHDIDHVCAVMEDALLRLLGRLGIHFTPIGPKVDYHGLRQPCFTRIADLFATMERERYDVWEVVTDRGRYWPSSKTKNLQEVRYASAIYKV